MAYTVGTPPTPTEDTRTLTAFLMDELRRIQLIFNEVPVMKLVQHNVEPLRPRDGMVAYADGINWNPGAGEGVYAYFNAQWNKL